MIKYSNLKKEIEILFESLLEDNRFEKYPDTYEDMSEYNNLSKEIWIAYNVSILPNLVNTDYLVWMEEWRKLKKSRTIDNEVLDKLFTKYNNNIKMVKNYINKKGSH